MKNMSYAVAQSGGPTSAINATLLGVIRGAEEKGVKVFGATNGIKGVINDDFIDLGEVFFNEEKRYKFVFIYNMFVYDIEFKCVSL